MKDSADVVAMVVDYGSFEALADCLSRHFKKVYYHSPCQDEFDDLQHCCKGDGIGGFERVDEIFSPQTVAEVDLYIFPDIGFGATQNFIRDVLHKPVWGSMGAHELEIYRTDFLKLVKEMELPMIHSETIKGVSALAAHLKTVDDKWIKCDRWRANMETWKHRDYIHSVAELDRMAVAFGGLKEYVTFVVQDAIDAIAEIGYDGWTVDGQFPVSSFQGYELKNELYLGSLLKADELPDQIKAVNKALAPTLAKYGYRNFIATEIRATDDSFYFIDPTMRMPGQTGEQLFETCLNLGEVIWSGANGILAVPQWNAKFAAAATLHYKGGGDGWMTLRVPEKIRRMIKCYHYCEVDGVYHFPPKDNGEIGVVLGLGNTIEETIDDLKANLDELKGEPVTAEVEGFADILRDVKDAQKQDIYFTDQRIPKPQEIIDP